MHVKPGKFRYCSSVALVQSSDSAECGTRLTSTITDYGRQMKQFNAISCRVQVRTQRSEIEKLFMGIVCRSTRQSASGCDASNLYLTYS
jgi:hypothetical protein